MAVPKSPPSLCVNGGGAMKDLDFNPKYSVWVCPFGFSQAAGEGSLQSKDVRNHEHSVEDESYCVQLLDLQVYLGKMMVIF